MLKLRKGDLGKAIVLGVLIVGVAGFSVYNVTRLKRASASVPTRAPAPNQAAAGGAPAGAEMFATREAGLSALLGRARSASDPFRPYLSLASRPAAPQLPAPIKDTSRARPLPAVPGETERTTVALVGIVSGTEPLAVLSDAAERYYVRAGDTLPSGWRVAAIYSGSVSLSKGRSSVRLPLAD